MPPKDFEAQAMQRLTGSSRHYCDDWDGMAIDETCLEFTTCTCMCANSEGENAKVQALKDLLVQSTNCGVGG